MTLRWGDPVPKRWRASGKVARWTPGGRSPLSVNGGSGTRAPCRNWLSGSIPAQGEPLRIPVADVAVTPMYLNLGYPTPPRRSSHRLLACQLACQLARLPAHAHRPLDLGPWTSGLACLPPRVPASWRCVIPHSALGTFVPSYLRTPFPGTPYECTHVRMYAAACTPTSGCTCDIGPRTLDFRFSLPAYPPATRQWLSVIPHVGSLDTTHFLM
jgi:hypothetical protein